MRIGVFAVLALTLGLGACAVVDVAADAADVAGTVVTTTVRTTGDVVGAAAHTVGGSSSDQDKKSR